MLQLGGALGPKQVGSHRIQARLDGAYANSHDDMFSSNGAQFLHTDLTMTSSYHLPISTFMIIGPNW
jgi:hypothetical protein